MTKIIRYNKYRLLEFDFIARYFANNKNLSILIIK